MTALGRRRAAASGARVRALRAARGLYRPRMSAADRRGRDIERGEPTTDDAHGGVPSASRFLRLEHLFVQRRTRGRATLRYVPPPSEPWDPVAAPVWPSGKTQRWWWHRVTRNAALPAAGDVIELAGVGTATVGLRGAARVVEITPTFTTARGERGCTGVCVLKAL